LTTESSDAELIARVITKRDEAAFSALYDRHTPALHGLSMRLMGASDPDIADIVQDAWFRASDALPRFRAQSTLRTWLCGFIVNCCRERIRDRVKSRAIPFEDRAKEAGPDARLHLLHAIDSLPHGYREVLVLHDVEGYTHEEIAAILGVEPGTSKSQLSRARAALRASLEGREQQ
jgi:RNA polymerase sigma factor (sigma-70 family)